MRAATVVILAIVFLAVGGWAAGYLLTAPSGAELFVRQGCFKCHVFGETGIGNVDLSEVCTRRSEVWMKDQIRNPRLHNKYSGMPSFGHLSRRQIEALVGYLRGPCD